MTDEEHEDLVWGVELVWNGGERFQSLECIGKDGCYSRFCCIGGGAASVLVSVDPKPVERMRLPGLREALAARGLRSSGSKKELVARLEEYLLAHRTGEAPDSTVKAKSNEARGAPARDEPGSTKKKAPRICPN
eukprot:m51a1_g7406 hypothetical protein (134) ;mRNA; r:185502-186062